MNLIKDPKIFNENSRIVMSRFLDFGGEATCKQLSKRYGESYQYYLTNSVNLAKRVENATGCPMPPSKDSGGGQSCIKEGIQTPGRTGRSFGDSGTNSVRPCSTAVILKKNTLIFFPNQIDGKKDAQKEANNIGEKYGRKDFLEEAFITEEEYDRLVSLLANKKNLILQGAQGSVKHSSPSVWLIPSWGKRILTGFGAYSSTRATPMKTW